MKILLKLRKKKIQTRKWGMKSKENKKLHSNGENTPQTAAWIHHEQI